MGRPLKKSYFGSASVNGESIASITIGGVNNAYIAKPNFTVAAPTLPLGVTATTLVHMGVVGITNFTAGTSGYAAGQTLTLTGGTGTAGTLTVSTTRVNTTTLVDRGVGYAPTNLLTLATGTGTAATATVTTTQVKTVLWTASGTGFAPGASVQTIATGVGTSATVTVTADGAGAVTGVAFLTAGSYTTNPTLTGVAVSGGAADLVIDITMEIGTITGPTGYGSYTVNPTLTAGATTGAGTGATITVTMGALTAAVATAGDYTVLPVDVTIVPATGGGTGALFNLTFKVVSAAIVLAGSGYASVPVVTVSAGNATGTAVLTTGGANAIVAYAYTGGSNKIADIVKQEGSTYYQVLTSDSVVGVDNRAVLQSHTPAAVGQMSITAYDQAGDTYWVTKLTMNLATLVRNTGSVYANNTSVQWSFDAAVDATPIVQIQNA